MIKEAFLLNEKTGLYRSTRAITTEDIIEQALVILMNRLKRTGTSLTSPQDTRDFLTLKLAHVEHELFSCIFLDNRHRVIEYEEMFRGTIDGASVYPREVVKSALSYNAAAIILAHNHPSGEPEPSAADKAITKRLIDVLRVVDIRILDHFVIGHSQTISFAERGLI